MEFFYKFCEALLFWSLKKLHRRIMAGKVECISSDKYLGLVVFINSGEWGVDGCAFRKFNDKVLVSMYYEKCRKKSGRHFIVEKPEEDIECVVPEKVTISRPLSTRQVFSNFPEKIVPVDEEVCFEITGM